VAMQNIDLDSNKPGKSSSAFSWSKTNKILFAITMSVVFIFQLSKFIINVEDTPEAVADFTINIIAIFFAIGGVAYVIGWVIYRATYFSERNGRIAISVVIVMGLLSQFSTLGKDSEKVGLQNKQIDLITKKFIEMHQQAADNNLAELDSEQVLLVLEKAANEYQTPLSPVLKKLASRMKEILTEQEKHEKVKEDFMQVDFEHIVKAKSKKKLRQMKNISIEYSNLSKKVAELYLSLNIDISGQLKNISVSDRYVKEYIRVLIKRFSEQPLVQFYKNQAQYGEVWSKIIGHLENNWGKWELNSKTDSIDFMDDESVDILNKLIEQSGNLEQQAVKLAN
jgi:hypothetical protein